MANTSKTNQAKQLLVRWMHEHHLQVGDRLPSQGTFRQEFGFGTATITAAVNELKQEGILEVRDKVGAYVRDPGADGHINYTIGLVSRHNERNLYYSTMITALHHKLSECGCSLRLFSMSAEKWTNDAPYLSVDDFPGLRRHIENRSIDGLIHFDDFTPAGLELIRSKSIPSVFIGSCGYTNAPCGVFLDAEASLHEVCRQLADDNPASVAVLSHSSLLPSVRRAMEQHFPGRCAYHGLQSKADAAALAEQLIATPAQARPSRMVYVDDLMATEITSILARTLPQEEIPPAVIMGPTPQLYPYPLRHATYFCYDIDAYISDALKILRNALTAGKSSDTKIIHTYREISSPS